MRASKPSRAQCTAVVVSFAAGLAGLSPGADAQLWTPLVNNGAALAGCGPASGGPFVLHRYDALASVHDEMSVSDSGFSPPPAPQRPWSMADAAIDITAGVAELSVSGSGHASRGPLPPPPNDGNAGAAADVRDEWSFSVGQPTCFTFSASINAASSNPTPGVVGSFLFGAESGAGITLSNGQVVGGFSGALNAAGEQSASASGTLAPGRYTLRLQGRADAANAGYPYSGSFSGRVSVLFGTASPGAPAQQPQDRTACATETAQFSVVPGGPAPVAFQWQWRTGANTWTELVNGSNALPDGRGLAASGVHTDHLSTQRDPAHLYDGDFELRCVLANGCGSINSDAATLSVCGADFNCDGFLDFFDVDGFVSGFEAGEPAADFNHDGFIDFFDVDAFVASFEAGC